MKKIICAALAAAMLLSGCTKVDESLNTTTTEIVPSADTEEEFVSPLYAQLTEEEKALYDKVREAVLNFEETVSFDPPAPRDSVRKIYRLVYSQERQYFWLSNIFYAPESEVATLRLNYLYEREDAELKRAELDFAASTIIGGLPSGASDFDKVVYFHDRIVTGCKFSTEEQHVNSAYGVLVTGYGQCEGYAAALALLCNKAGIPNYVACGTNADGDTHAWNKIRLDGEWYNADCTWDDPIIERNNPDFVRHDYLLVKDSEIEGRTHFTDPLYSGYTLCTSDRLNYFSGAGLMFDNAEAGVEELVRQVKEKGSMGKREVEVRFSDVNAFYAAMARLFDSGEMKDIIEDTNERYGTKIRSAYKHNNEDLCIVHISLIYESDE
ncbi:MAG: hypothetical protein IKK42_05990 [Oscillospiraceae bacterium]|nr:hypothetical protein [Oscillospiraceae bacterium]